MSNLAFVEKSWGKSHIEKDDDRDHNSKCFLEGFLEGACEAFQ